MVEFNIVELLELVHNCGYTCKKYQNLQDYNLASCYKIDNLQLENDVSYLSTYHQQEAIFLQ